MLNPLNLIILLGISYLILSLGVFAKLDHYGSPKSAFGYAGILPLVSVYKYLKDRPTFSIYRFFWAFKNVSLLTGISCIALGEHQIGLNSFLPFVQRSIIFHDWTLEVLESDI